jgi:hypothetical protein
MNGKTIVNPRRRIAAEEWGGDGGGKGVAAEEEVTRDEPRWQPHAWPQLLEQPSAQAFCEGEIV